LTRGEITTTSSVGYVYTLSAGVSFGSTAILTTLLRNMGIPSIEQGFFRILLTTLFFGSILLLKPQIRSIRREDVKFFILNGLFGVSLSIIAYLSSIALGTPVAVAVTLSYLQPMFTVILGRFVLAEAVTSIKVAAVAVSVFGASIVSGIWQVFGSIGSINPVGVVLASLNGFFYAVYIMIGRLSGSNKKYDFATTMFYSFFFALIWVIPLWFLAGSLMAQPIVSGLVLDIPSQGWVLLLMIGVIGTIIPYGLLSLGLRHIPASMAGIVLLVEPISVMIMGVIILGQALTPWGILGSALVLSATILISIEARMHKPSLIAEKKQRDS
jgi:drug/metabolite transporter (DMT)-like permease